MVLSKVECVCVVCPRIYTQHHHQRIITALTLSQTLTYFFKCMTNMSNMYLVLIGIGISFHSKALLVQFWNAIF